MDEIVDTLLSRQNHATLLRSINKEKLIGLVSKLPDVIHTEPSIEKVEEKSTVESESEKIESEKAKPKFTMPILCHLLRGWVSHEIDCLACFDL